VKKSKKGLLFLPLFVLFLKKHTSLSVVVVSLEDAKKLITFFCRVMSFSRF
jgi:hypothetical protein